MTIKEVYRLEALFNAVVIDNCATLRLVNGDYAVYKGGQINPEYNSTQEFWDYHGRDSIILPVVAE